ncbi:hypothetical protein GCM10025857_18720 [Alicyclobacillus contaminans]|nr:hypothetical protein GCM10025857_18720 [Alicyclobacillus contaminans]
MRKRVTHALPSFICTAHYTEAEQISLSNGDVDPWKSSDTMRERRHILGQLDVVLRFSYNERVRKAVDFG